jgi:hypothetical protein
VPTSTVRRPPQTAASRIATPNGRFQRQPRNANSAVAAKVAEVVADKVLDKVGEKLPDLSNLDDQLVASTK